MTSLAPVKPDQLYADRVKVYTKDVHGDARRAKWAILAFCLQVYYILPWIRWNRGPGVPNQAILLDLFNERFYFFNVVLWPQDIYLLAGALILGACLLFFVTALFGRLWCGYTCPQTVWTDLYMLVERWIEGDRNARMKRDKSPWNAETWRLKLTKHAVWLFIAFWTGGSWIMYYADAPTTVVQFWTGTAPVPVYAMTLLFTATTYLLAGMAREQVCTYMCPWPRFQAAMLDEQSLIVTYQGWRGEPRHAGRRDPATTSEKFGDCVDCDACWHVCPTGVDIRKGAQLECINCGLCVDACNHVMSKIGALPNLITWDTLASQKAKAQGKTAPFRLVRPRTIFYATLVIVVASGLFAAFDLRSTATLSVIHDRAPLFVRLQNGTLRNGYTIKIANKTRKDATYDLTVDGLDHADLLLAQTGAKGTHEVSLDVPASTVGEFRLLIHASETSVTDGRTPLTFVLHQKSGHKITYKQLFMGPGAEE
jgi:cytochrome c oxidase accessory protein FixG